MRIYSQGREIGLGELERIARAQQVRAWLIGEYHHEKNGEEFQREVARRIRPKKILTEDKIYFDSINSYTPEEARRYLEERGDIEGRSALMEVAVEVGADLINCDKLPKEEIKKIEERALFLRYGTSSRDEIASRYYGVPVRDYRGDEAKKYCEDLYRVTTRASCTARNEIMAEYIAHNLGTVENPALGSFGAAHLCLKEPNILIHPPLRDSTILVINPLEVKDNLPLSLDVLSYDAMIVRPTSTEDFKVRG